MEHTRIVISDLHVGQNDDFDIFATSRSTKHKLFTNFMAHIREQANPIELIINGDFVDFLQLQPWNDLSRGTAVEKITKIVEKSPSVFQDLGLFVGVSRHRLKILPGNHDVELVYPEVAHVLRNAILTAAPEAETRFEMFSPALPRTTYVPNINGVKVHIEHGNEGDPFNSLNYNDLLTDAEKNTKDFSYPPGTKLVYDIMNDFKQHLRFVDLLKPEMPAVVLILLALKPFMAALGIPGVAIKGLQAVGNSILAMLRRKIMGLPLGQKGSVDADTLDANDIEEFLSRTFPADESPSERQVDIFLEGTEIPGIDDPTLGPSLRRVRLWLLAWALDTLARFQTVKQGDAFFNSDHPNNAAAKGAQTRLRGDVKAVVFGHTHEALKTEFAEGLYINSGTWADLVTLPRDGKEAMTKWLEAVANNSFERTAYPTFVKLEPAGNGLSVSLNLWTDSGEQQLWAKNI